MELWLLLTVDGAEVVVDSRWSCVVVAVDGAVLLLTVDGAVVVVDSRWSCVVVDSRWS